MANTEITINNVIEILEGFITTVLRSTGGPLPPIGDTEQKKKKELINIYNN